MVTAVFGGLVVVVIDRYSGIRYTGSSRVVDVTAGSFSSERGGEVPPDGASTLERGELDEGCEGEPGGAVD